MMLTFPLAVVRRGLPISSRKLPSILARLAGLAMLITAAALLHSFVMNPRGTLPWARQSWSGGPLILGSAFLAIQGAYLLVMCRFSLSGVVVAGLASGGLAVTAHNIVSNITETSRIPTVVRLSNNRSQEKFVSKSRTMLSPERLEALIHDFDSAGYQTTGIDFDSVTTTYVPAGGAYALSEEMLCGVATGDEHPLLVTLNFNYSPFLHSRLSETRVLLSAYTRLVNSWIIAQQAGNGDKAAAATAELLCLWIYPSRSSYRESPPKYLDLSLLKRMHKASDERSDLLKTNLSWLAAREQDSEFKFFLQCVAKKVDEIEQIPPPPKPRPQVFRG